MSLSSMFTTIAWYCIQGYTQIEMWWNYYFAKKENSVDFDDDSKFPFTIVEKDGLYQVYYPKLEKTDYTFMQVEIEVEGNKYEIDTKPFMVVGNRLFDRPFTDWVLGFEHGIELEEEQEYTVHILDHDVNMFMLSPKEYIELNKDNYLKKCLDE